MTQSRQIQHPLKKVLLLLIGLGCLGVSKANIGKPVAENEPIFFVNQGQWPSRVLAKADLSVGDFWLTNEGFVLNLLDTATTELLHERTVVSTAVNTHAVFLKFLKSNPLITASGGGEVSET